MASAGKSLTSFLAGLAQQEGLIRIENKTSDYLGRGWTSLTPEKEDMIKVKHQLTITTGLDHTVADVDCTTPSCLKFNADAGSQWYYHYAHYTRSRALYRQPLGEPATATPTPGLRT